METTSESRLPELKNLVPPRSLIRRHGGEQFRHIGRAWVETFRNLADLRPNDRVLDVGCGPGRMALRLAPVLGSAGRYEGFDIRKQDIAWCRAEIASRWPRSRFQLVDVSNGYYNRRGKLTASEFRFPYDDASFDFVFLTSVFTHLVPDDVKNYLRQVHRVLQPGGRCLATFFLLNENATAAIAAKKARFSFRYEIAPYCRSEKRWRPERVIAYDEGFVREEYARVGLEIAEPVHFGAWSRAPTTAKHPHDQDIVIAYKR